MRLRHAYDSLHTQFIAREILDAIGYYVARLAYNDILKKSKTGPMRVAISCPRSAFLTSDNSVCLSNHHKL